MTKSLKAGNRPVEPLLITEKSGGSAEAFPLPVDEDFLHEFLRHVFENYWDKIIYGPMIEGAAYELFCPSPPTKVVLYDGYLSIFFGATHFHLCIGENKGSENNPTPETLQQHRRTARAEMFRSLDGEGAPVHWGLRLFNGAGEQQMTIFLPSPFLSDELELLDTPDWSRLGVWEELCARYLNRQPDPKDRTAAGFSHT